MKIGDYIRTKKSGIGKIISFNFCEDNECCFIDLSDRRAGIRQVNIIKSSSNIFDVLALGDFVKIEYYSPKYDERIERIFEIDFNEMNSICFNNGHCQLNIFNGEWSNEDKRLNPIIKSIVTKEQFKEMEYKI